MILNLAMSFIPWVIFFIFVNPQNMQTAIIVSFVAFIVLNVRGLFYRIAFDWISFLFFLGSTLLVFAIHANWYNTYCFLIGNIVLMATALISYAIKKPFIAKYAKLASPVINWLDPIFIKTNNILTLIWGGIFTFNVLTSLIALPVYGHTVLFNWVVYVIIIILGLWFTMEFPAWYRHRELQKLGIVNLHGLSEIEVAVENNTFVAFRTIGQGKPLILLMDANMTMHYWDPELINGLAQSYQVVIFEYPGIGASNMEGDFNLANLTQFTLALIKELNHPKVNLLGFGLGGWIAQKFALEHADLVEKLVLINSDFGGDNVVLPHETVLEFRANTILATPAQETAFIKFLIPQKQMGLVAPKVKNIIHAAKLEARLTKKVTLNENKLAEEWYCGEGVYNDLEKLQTPTLIIFGIENIVIPIENGQLLAGKIPNNTYIKYEECGHGIFYQKPLELVKEIKQFVDN